MTKTNKSNPIEYLPGFLKGKPPGQLVLQLTTHCNARCPQCGMSIANKFERKRLSIQRVKQIIDAAVERGVKSLSFTGGEPFLHLDALVELIGYANKAGIPLVRTGTNGFIFMNPNRNGYCARLKNTAEKLAGVDLRNMWISIDSSEPSFHENMRGLPGVIGGIKKGLKIFHEAGLFPSANMGINRNLAGRFTADLKPEKFSSESDYLKVFSERFEQGFTKFLDFVVNLGFTIVSFCYPMSVDAQEPGDLEAVYAATSTARLIRFNRKEKACLFRALLRAVEPFRSRIRIFTPRCALYALARQYSNSGEANHTYPCRGGLDYFFVNAEDGMTYPCGYRGGDRLGRFEDGKISDIEDCRRCDWECFRDPSELFGPLTGLFPHPFNLLGKMRKEPEFFKLWIKDLRYNIACDFFDGGKNIDFSKLRAFKAS